MVSIIREGEIKRELIYTNEKCVGCGICSDICPTSALKLGPLLPIARGILDKDYITINHDTCVLCGLCSFACPFDAMNLEIDGKNAKSITQYPKWDSGSEIIEKECIYCGKCELACPKDAILINRNLPNLGDLVKGEIRKHENKCISCYICEEMCPSNAIKIKNGTSNPTRFDVEDIEIDKTKCMYCGICEKVCPKHAIDIICTTCMEYEKIHEVEITGTSILDENHCINCGWCEKVCPVDAAHVIKPFEGEIIVNEDEVCKGESCHACKDLCPCNAITLTKDSAIIDPDVCTLCGACVKACPRKIISINRSSMKLNNIKSNSWNKILSKLISE